MKHTRTLKNLLCLGWIALVPACGGDGGNGSGSEPDGSTGTDAGTDTLADAGALVSATIGPEGGELRNDAGVIVTVPAGAVSAAQTFTLEAVSVPSAELPDGVEAAGPVWELGPSGVTFAVPVTVEFPVQGGGTDGLLVFRQADGATEWLPAGTGAAGSTSVAVATTAFSRWFVGSLAIPGCDVGRNCQVQCSAGACSGSCDVRESTFALQCAASAGGVGVTCACGTIGNAARSFTIERLPGPFDLAAVVWGWARFCGYPCGDTPPTDTGLPDADVTDAGPADVGSDAGDGQVRPDVIPDAVEPTDTTPTDVGPIGDNRRTWISTLWLENSSAAPFGNAYDTELLAFNRAETPVEVAVTLGGPADGLLRFAFGGTDQVVCNPCTFVVPARSQARFSLSEAISATPGAFTGAFGVTLAGWMRAEVRGEDVDRMALATHIIHAHSAYDEFSGLADVSHTVTPLHPMTDAAALPVYYGVPWFQDDSALATSAFQFGPESSSNAVDAMIRLVYDAAPTDPALAWDIWLLELDSNTPLRSSTGIDVCNPCSETLNPAVARQRSISIAEFFVARGGVGAGAREGRALIRIREGLPGRVALDLFSARSWTNQSDTDISVAPLVRLPLERTIDVEPLRIAIPMVREEAGSVAAGTGGSVTLQLASFGGVTPDLQNAAFSIGGGVVSMWIYASETGRTPLLGTGGTAVCDPCRYVLGSSNPTDQIRLDALPGWPVDTTTNAFIRMELDSPFPQDMAVSLLLEQPAGAGRRPAHGIQSLPVLDVIAGAGPSEWVIPWFVERPGATADTENTFDTWIAADNRGPNDGVPGTELTVGRWPTGTFAGGAGPICSPSCDGFAWSPTRVHGLLGLGTVLDEATGLRATAPREGWAIVTPGEGTSAYLVWGALTQARMTGTAGRILPLPVMPIP